MDMNSSKRVFGEITNAKLREQIKAYAECYGLTYNAVKYDYLLVDKQVEIDMLEGRIEDVSPDNIRTIKLLKFNQKIQKTVENHKRRESLKAKGNKNKVTIIRNPMLWGMLDMSRNEFHENVDNYEKCVYNIRAGREFMRVQDTEKGRIGNLRFEQLVLLSAIYSQLKSCSEKPDLDNRYPISLRSIYEYVHGRSLKWCRVSNEDREGLKAEVRELENHFKNHAGTYHYTIKRWSEKSNKVRKDYDDAEIGNDFFIHGNWEGDFFMCYRDIMRMYDIYKGQEEMLTTLPEDMLAVKNERRLDGLKYYLAYRVVEGNNDDSKLRKAVSYDGIVKLFGADHREFVKRYMKFLEEKGHVKNLKLDKDAVRWE